MSAHTLARAVRKPLVWLVVVAALLLTMLALETSGSRHAPSVVPLSTVAHSSSTATNSNTGGNGLPAHCTDGHGNDGNQNPHCRAISSD